MTTKTLTEMSSTNGDASWRIPYPNPFWSRLVSLLLAITLSALILIFPRAIAVSISDVNHGLLTLLMWGIATGFVHGVGFVPRMAIWRIAFNPSIGWPLMGYGVLLTQSAT